MHVYSYLYLYVYLYVYISTSISICISIYLLISRASGLETLFTAHIRHKTDATEKTYTMQAD